MIGPMVQKMPTSAINHDGLELMGWICRAVGQAGQQEPLGGEQGGGGGGGSL